MIHALLSQPAAEADRHAYNAAFEELGLPWYWDCATHACLRPHGRDGVRTYLETEQPHLLRAYEADFLVNAIETAKARYQANASLPHVAPPARRSNDSQLRLVA